MRPADEVDAGGDRPNPRFRPTDPRYRFVRRRLVAAATFLLVAIWVVSLVSSGGSHRPPAPAPAVADAGATGRVGTSAAATTGASELARENQAVQTALGYTAYVTSGSASKREIALTFDDGPGPYTPQIVAILKRHKVPATFFVVGRSVKDFGVYLPSELAAGFVLGDHTQDHEPMAALSLKDQTAQLVDQAADIEHYGAPFPHLFRPPYGSFNETTLSITKRLKMLTILWTIDTNDFAQPGVKKIVNAVLDGARPGAIVLMHDAGGTRTQTVQALPTIIRALRKRGYTLVTVPRLLADDPPLEADQVPPKGLSGG
ncbi:MAG TPA: polysaccharide deacetylase family protein [Solirubrobacteraceae bacterium]|nr:polysaccharide deacetylase family protein [Solirubrobacteraceae bacterium]